MWTPHTYLSNKYLPITSNFFVESFTICMFIILLCMYCMYILLFMWIVLQVCVQNRSAHIQRTLPGVEWQRALIWRLFLTSVKECWPCSSVHKSQFVDLRSLVGRYGCLFKTRPGVHPLCFISKASTNKTFYVFFCLVLD